jgi:hypothetical protein
LFPTSALEYVIRNVEANQEGLKLIRTNQLMVYADIIIISHILWRETHKLYQPL